MMSFATFTTLASWVWRRKILAIGLVVAVVAGAFFVGRASVKPMRLVEEKILREVERIPYGVPTPYEVRIPGTHTKETITIEKRVEVPGKERIVTVTGPVFCKTEEECKKIFGAAEQRLTINAAIRQGTVVPVCTLTLPVSPPRPFTGPGPCPEEATQNLPLARDFPFEMRLVMSERGVFHALDLPNFPVKPITVTTETLVTSAPSAPLFQRGFTFGVRTDFRSAWTDVVYRNLAFGGEYQVRASVASWQSGPSIMLVWDKRW